MARIDERLPNDVKNSLWVARNYKQVFIASVSVAVISVVFSFITVNRQSSVIEEQSQVIKNMANKVVFVRADGKVVQLEKEDVGGNAVMYALRDIAINYLLLSGFDIRESEVKEFKDLTNVYKVSRMLKYLTEEGLRGYKAYLERLYSAYQNDALPEIIQTTNLQGLKEDFQYQDARFSYVFELPVDVLYVKYEKWNRGKGSIVIVMKGEVDMNSSSPENPLGIRIENIEVRQYVSK